MYSDCQLDSDQYNTNQGKGAVVASVANIDISYKYQMWEERSAQIKLDK